MTSNIGKEKDEETKAIDNDKESKLSKDHHCNEDPRCTLCCRDPSEDPEEYLKSIVSNILDQGIPVAMPIVDADPIYTFTIGMGNFIKDCGELVIVGLSGGIAGGIFNKIFQSAKDGKTNVSTWKEGTILLPSITGANVPLQIHILNESECAEWLGNSRRTFWSWKLQDHAFQLMWPDKNQVFSTSILSKQQFRLKSS